MSFLIRVVETISRMVLTKFMFVLFPFVSLVDFFEKKVLLNSHVRYEFDYKIQNICFYFLCLKKLLHFHKDVANE